MGHSSVPHCTVKKIVMSIEAKGAEQKQEDKGMYIP